MKVRALGLAMAMGCGLLATSAFSASAAPVNAGVLGANAKQGSGVELAQYRKRPFKKGYRQGYRAGSRHANAPRNWRRYGSRPGDWRTRGCIIVGPIWYCP